MYFSQGTWLIEQRSVVLKEIAIEYLENLKFAWGHGSPPELDECSALAYIKFSQVLKLSNWLQCAHVVINNQCQLFKLLELGDRRQVGKAGKVF